MAHRLLTRSLALNRTTSATLRPSPLLLRSPLRPFRTTPSFNADTKDDARVKDAPGAGSRGPSGNVSQTISDAKSEASGIKRSFQQAVGGGGSVVSGADHGGVQEAAQTLSNVVNMRAEVPRGAQVFGIAGLVPYLATSLTTVYLSRQAGLAGVSSTSSAVNEAATVDPTTALALLHNVEILQVSYGALILSFLGAIHWGFEFSKYGGEKGWPRFALGIFPTIIAWPTLLLDGQVALAAQWAAFTAVWVADLRATSMGWAPRWYSTYRFYLTAIVGGSIILTLVGSTYFGPLSGGAWMTTGEKLATIAKEEEDGKTGTKVGRVDGKVETVPGKDSYVTFVDVEKKREREEEERKKAAEEEAQKKKEEAQARRERAESARSGGGPKNPDAGKSQ